MLLFSFLPSRHAWTRLIVVSFLAWVACDGGAFDPVGDDQPLAPTSVAEPGRTASGETGTMSVGPFSTMAAECGEPDPSVVLLDDADIYDVSEGDMITVIAEPFADDELVGAWIRVRTVEDLPVEFFQIIANQHYQQNNISVFTVAEDLENAGGSYWWFYDGQTTFDIVAAVECIEEQERPWRGRGDLCEQP